MLSTKLPANGDENKSLNVCAHKTENIPYLQYNYLLYIRIRYLCTLAY